MGSPFLAFPIQETKHAFPSGSVGNSAVRVAIAPAEEYPEWVSAAGAFQCANRLLNGLGVGDLARLQPNLKRVRLTAAEALHRPGAPIDHVYFPESAMVSMLTVMKSGEQIETAIIGLEGIIGGWVAIDGGTINILSTVQIEGFAWQVTAGAAKSNNLKLVVRR